MITSVGIPLALAASSLFMIVSLQYFPLLYLLRGFCWCSRARQWCCLFANRVVVSTTCLMGSGKSSELQLIYYYLGNFDRGMMLSKLWAWDEFCSCKNNAVEVPSENIYSSSIAIFGGFLMWLNPYWTDSADVQISSMLLFCLTAFVHYVIPFSLLYSYKPFSGSINRCILCWLVFKPVHAHLRLKLWKNRSRRIVHLILKSQLI
jgi:hypothetical protein